MNYINTYLAFTILFCIGLISIEIIVPCLKVNNRRELITLSNDGNSLLFDNNDCLTASKPKAKIHLGVLNAKAINQPIPKYSEDVVKKQITGTVLSDIVVDSSTGIIIWAKIISGPKLLREEVANMICQVKFPPANDLGHHIMVSGTLKWKFMRCSISTKPFVYCIGH